MIRSFYMTTKLDAAVSIPSDTKRDTLDICKRMGIVASSSNKVEHVTQLGCWSRPRRKYYEALQVLPANHRSGTAAAKGLAFCNALCEVEHKWKEATAVEPVGASHHLHRESMGKACYILTRRNANIPKYDRHVSGGNERRKPPSMSVPNWPPMNVVNDSISSSP